METITIEKGSFERWMRMIFDRLDRQDRKLCKSINKEYDDFEVPKDGVFHVALVVGSIRLF